MVLLLAFLLLTFCIILVLLLPVLWGRDIYRRYSGPRAVTCPETHEQVGVTIGAAHVAATGLCGPPEFRLTDCTRWPARIRCGQGCLAEALRNPPYTEGEVHLPKSQRQIFHLPVLLAAFAAWYAGMIWHSQYLFRARWMHELSLTPAQVKQLVAWYSPHLLSVAACLLFAYGVAWLYTWLEHKGVWQGIFAATLLWVALMVVTLPSMLGLSHTFLLIEAGYGLVATLLVGAIIGGLSGRMLLREV